MKKEKNRCCYSHSCIFFFSVSALYPDIIELLVIPVSMATWAKASSGCWEGLSNGWLLSEQTETLFHFFFFLKGLKLIFSSFLCSNILKLINPDTNKSSLPQDGNLIFQQCCKNPLPYFIKSTVDKQNSAAENLPQNMIKGANLAFKSAWEGRMTHLPRLQMLQFS